MPTTPKIAPVHPELLKEIQDLSYNVARLHRTFVKRRVLYAILMIETVIVAGVVSALFIMNTYNLHQTRDLVDKLVVSCQVRNQQVNGTDQFILDIEKLQTQAYKHIPVQFRTTEQIKIEHEYTRVLNKWRRSQPNPFPCKGYQK